MPVGPQADLLRRHVSQFALEGGGERGQPLPQVAQVAGGGGRAAFGALLLFGEELRHDFHDWLALHCQHPRRVVADGFGQGAPLEPGEGVGELNGRHVERQPGRAQGVHDAKVCRILPGIQHQRLNVALVDAAGDSVGCGGWIAGKRPKPALAAFVEGHKEGLTLPSFGAVLPVDGNAGVTLGDDLRKRGQFHTRLLGSC